MFSIVHVFLWSILAIPFPPQIANNMFLTLFFSDGLTLHSTRLSLDNLDFPHPPLCKGDEDDDEDEEGDEDDNDDNDHEGDYDCDDENNFVTVSPRDHSNVQ